MYNPILKNNQGYILLISVLIIGAIGTAIVLSILLYGTGQSSAVSYLQQSYQAKAVADACAEEALQQIRSSASYSGTGNLTLGQGSCVYTVVNTGGQSRTVSAAGTVGVVVRRVAITLDRINPTINIAGWQEI